MKKYLAAIIFLILGAFSILFYKLIGSSVAPDGTLIEPFWLIPTAWLFLIVGVSIGIFVSIKK